MVVGAGGDFLDRGVLVSSLSPQAASVSDAQSKVKGMKCRFNTSGVIFRMGVGRHDTEQTALGPAAGKNAAANAII